MRTSEFKEAVEELGFRVDGNCDYGFNIDNERDTIACVSNRVEYNIDTDWFDFEETELIKREKLFSILVKYASTPIAEREEEKRYRLRSTNKHTKHCYLSVFPNGNFDIFSKTLCDLQYASEFNHQAVFTESELKNIDETGFERIEVEQ